jgi:Ca-activated chloride channel family protein
MVKIAFTDQYANLLFLLNGLVILFFAYSLKKKKERTMKFGNYETLKKVAGGKVLQSNILLAVTRVIAISALLIGLSSPVLIQQVQGADKDFVIAMDSSSSMFTGDIQPNRFQAAKEASKNFLNQLGNTSRVGLITYSGNVTQQAELTSDHNQIKTEIEEASIGGAAGTATGDAIASSVSMLLGSKKNRSVILITDGVSNVGQSINKSASFASRQNVTVNPIGIGGTGENTSQEDFGNINGQNASRADFNNLNESRIQQVANETGGEAVFVSDSEGLESAFLQLEETETEKPIGEYLILLAGLLLVFDAILRTTDFEVVP